MSLFAAERIQVLVRCNHCGQTSQKFLSGLIGKETTDCVTPGCKGPISLKDTDNAVIIEKLAEQLPGIAAALTKEGGER